MQTGYEEKKSHLSIRLDFVFFSIFFFFNLLPQTKTKENREKEIRMIEKPRSRMWLFYTL